MARQRYCRRLTRYRNPLRVSADPVAKPAAQTRAESRVLDLRKRLRERDRLSAGGRWIRTSGTADDARLLADLYTHNASRQMPQKGSSDQAVACLRRLGAGVVGSAAVCAFRFRPPGTGSKRAGWRRSGAFFGAVCFEPDASRARLRFKAVMRSMTGGGAAISLGLTVSPFILASISSCKAS
jgi:hypothetical protein